MSNPYDVRSWVGGAVAATRAVLQVADWTEVQLMSLARAGLDALDNVAGEGANANKDGKPRALTGGASSDSAPRPQGRIDSRNGSTVAPEVRLNHKMTKLLDQALNQGTHDSKLELFGHILDQLVADEARLLGALSDGTASPLINVIGRASSRAPVLQNAALIGRTANLALPSMVPAYVTHLVALGLVEIGPEDPELKTDYEVLAAETMVLRAIKESSVGPVGPKIDKRTLRLSPLGMELWQTSMQPSMPGDM